MSSSERAGVDDAEWDREPGRPARDASESSMRAPRLLPGRSAYDWVMYVVLDTPVCVLALVAIPVVAHTMPVGASGRLALIYLFATVGWVGALVLGIAAVGVWRAMKRETAAGYTTLFDPRKRNLWQLNAKTGEVVRVPGADTAGQDFVRRPNAE